MIAIYMSAIDRSCIEAASCWSAPEVSRLQPPRPRNCTHRPLSPNKSLQRAWTHKVLGRGRSDAESTRALRARVLRGRRAAAELSR